MSIGKKILFVCLLIFSFAGFIYSGLLFGHRYVENQNLISLRNEYQDLKSLIEEYEEVKNSYTSVLGEENNLNAEKKGLEDKVNSLNQEIVDLQEKIQDVNKKIKAIS